MNNFLFIKRKVIGLIFILGGYLLSYILYVFLFEEQHKYGFFHSDSFFIIGMPIMFIGTLLVLPFIKKKDLVVGVFAKILFCIITIVWIAMVVGMFIR